MILVTGATGTIGRQVVRELLARGVEFRVAAHDTAKVTQVLGPEINSVPFDYMDPPSVRRAFESAKTVYLLHIGGSNGRHQATAAIDMAREVGVERIVLQSAFGADDKPGYSLGTFHREVELYLLASGLTGTVLRPNSFMENHINFLGGPIKQEGKLYEPLGDARVSYIAARDVGAVAAEVLVSEGYENQSYDLTGPEAVSGAEVADALSRATGRPIEYVNVSDDAVRQALAGASEEEIEGILELYAYDRSGATARVTHTVEEIAGRPAQDIRAWAIEHADAFMPDTALV